MSSTAFWIHDKERSRYLSSRGVFKRVHQTRSFEAIVEQIQSAILDGTIQHNQRLASERALVEEFGVSRATLREALRGLEALGWVEIKTGAQGGIFAVRPSADRAGSALEALLRFHEVSPRDLEEFRVSFEPETAAWAAKRATDIDIANLRRLVTELHAATEDGDVEWPLVSDLDFDYHLALASASGNRVRLAVMLAVQHSVKSASRAIVPLMTEEIRRSIAHELEAVTEAIADRDPEEARAAMLHHVERFSRMETEWLEGPVSS